MHNRWFRVIVAAIAALGIASASAPTASAAPSQPQPKECELPSAGETFGSATPAQEALDASAVRKAIAYASTHLRLSVQVFRNNCRVAAGPLNSVVEQVPNNVWSSTKSVVSLLVGIASDQGALSLDDPIDRYLPAGPGWGDEAKRAITIRQLLTQTSGLRQSILTEAATTGTDPHIAQQALAQPLVHEPGTTFAYGQRGVDLLAYVVQRAVGEDLQAFAQRHLFDPVGIPDGGYIWLRDRSGNTYGYAHLFLPPMHYAKLGLLMQNEGDWNGHRVVSRDYVRKVGRPTGTNGCYGLLFWTNAGDFCTSADIPSAQTTQRNMVLSAPRDLYAMVGFGHQNNFVIPSLDMTVTWTGMFGDTPAHLGGLLSADLAASDLYHNFFRLLMRAVQDKDIPDPGPHVAPPMEFDIDPTNFADPAVLLSGLAANPDCNVLACEGRVPVRGLIHNGQSVVGAAGELLTPR